MRVADDSASACLPAVIWGTVGFCYDVWNVLLVLRQQMFQGQPLQNLNNVRTFFNWSELPDSCLFNRRIWMSGAVLSSDEEDAEGGRRPDFGARLCSPSSLLSNCASSI